MSSAKDSAESHSEWRKVRKDIWNISQKVKEISNGYKKTEARAIPYEKLRASVSLYSKAITSTPQLPFLSIHPHAGSWRG